MMSFLDRSLTATQFIIRYKLGIKKYKMKLRKKKKHEKIRILVNENNKINKGTLRSEIKKKLLTR